jgi:sugar phosphate isomerase/epimerase
MKCLNRREFVQAVAVPAIVSATRLRADTRLPLAFSTLGCPKWPWKAVLDNAVANGYAAIELRGIEGDMDLPKRPELTGSGLQQSRADLKAHGLKISDLGSSVELHEPDAAKRARQIDDGRRFIDLAHEIGAPYVRVFGNKYVEGEPKATTVARIAEGMRTLGEYAGQAGVMVIIESHGDFTDSAVLRDLLEHSGPHAALLWDTHHTVVEGKEAPADTFARVGRYVKHTHIKDSVPAGHDRKYVLTGQGDLPLTEIVKTLVAGRYQGYYCFEWEKVWHPDIAEPELAIPQYAKAMRGYLEQAGFKART